MSPSSPRRHAAWQWKVFGKLKDRETVVEGLERVPAAINMLFTGGNIGKLIVKL
jgi:NADPH-dependent curcumin reductase